MHRIGDRARGIPDLTESGAPNRARPADACVGSYNPVHVPTDSRMKLRILTVLLVSAASLGAPESAAEPTSAAGAGDAGGRAQFLGRTFVGRDTPLVGVVVVVHPHSVPSRYLVTSTDAKGWFRFETLDDGTWTVELRKEGYRSIVKEGIGLKAPFRAVLELPMEREESPPGHETRASPDGSPGTARLEGSVRADDRGAVGEVRVRLRRVEGEESIAAALTGPDGRFAFDRLEAGIWRLELVGAGFLPIRVPLELEGDVALEARLVSQPAAYDADPEDLMPLEEPIPPP